MSYVILVANVLFLLFIGSIKTLNSSRIKISVFLWSSLIILLLYYVFFTNEMSDTYFRFMFIETKIPLYFAVLIILGLLFQIKLKNPPRLIKTIAVFIVSYLSLYYYNYGLIPITCNFEVSNEQIAVNSMILNLLLTFGLFVPFAVFAESKKNNFMNLGFIKFDNYKKHKRAINICLILLFFLFIFNNMKFGYYLVNFKITTPLLSFLISSVLYIFYYSFVVHFVCFFITTKFLEEFLEGESFFWGLVLAGGIVYGSISFRSGDLGQMGIEFLFGIVFSYLYMKTRSLSYGIIFSSIVAIVT